MKYKDDIKKTMPGRQCSEIMINIMCGLRPHNGLYSVQGTQTRRPYYIVWHINNGSDCIHIKCILYFFFFASKIIIIRKIMKNYARKRWKEGRYPFA